MRQSPPLHSLLLQYLYFFSIYVRIPTYCISPLLQYLHAFISIIHSILNCLIYSTPLPLSLQYMYVPLPVFTVWVRPSSYAIKSTSSTQVLQVHRNNNVSKSSKFPHRCPRPPLGSCSVSFSSSFSPSALAKWMRSPQFLIDGASSDVTRALNHYGIRRTANSVSRHQWDRHLRCQFGLRLA